MCMTSILSVGPQLVPRTHYSIHANMHTGVRTCKLACFYDKRHRYHSSIHIYCAGQHKQCHVPFPYNLSMSRLKMFEVKHTDSQVASGDV